MIVCLVQHAEANSEDQDPARALSAKGLADITKTASYASRLNIDVNKIFHSPKLRARQTAQVLADCLKPTNGHSETAGLAPLDDPFIWADRLKAQSDNIMLVGHLPHLGKLASLLLSGHSDKNVVSFKKAGIVCLERDEDQTWSVQWMITPEIII